MGVITTPFSLYVMDQWTSDGEGKQHTEFLFSGQWLDKINAGVPFSSLPCPAMVRVLVWAQPHKNFAGIIFRGLAGALENREI